MKRILVKIMMFIHLVLSYVPLIAIVLFLFYVLEATYILGRLPEYGNPDSKFLKQPIFMEVIDFFYSGLLYSLIIWPLLSLLSSKLNLYLLSKKVKFSWYIGVAIGIVILTIDPFGLMSWFAD